MQTVLKERALPGEEPRRLLLDRPALDVKVLTARSHARVHANRGGHAGLEVGPVGAERRVVVAGRRVEVARAQEVDLLVLLTQLPRVLAGEGVEAPGELVVEIIGVADVDEVLGLEPDRAVGVRVDVAVVRLDRKSTRLNSSHT